MSSADCFTGAINIEIEPYLIGVNRNGKRSENISRDAQSYLRADSGCREATAFLGCQSHCMDCPFLECLGCYDHITGSHRKWLAQTLTSQPCLDNKE